jgi:hypothetical protein
MVRLLLHQKETNKQHFKIQEKENLIVSPKAMNVFPLDRNNTSGNTFVAKRSNKLPQLNQIQKNNINILK